MPEGKSMYQFSGKSKQRLVGVHPELVRVANRAIERTRIDFGISEGVRTEERQYLLYQEKKTTTLHSQHFIDKNTGFGHAIDIFAYVNGKAQFGRGSEKYYGPIIQTFITEATALGVQLRFGHLWKDFKDSFHIELNPRFY